jgi:hypothetical protein
VRTAGAFVAGLALLATLASPALGLSEPAYVKAANRICAQRAPKLDRLAHYNVHKASAAKIAGRLSRIIPLYAQGLRRLRALEVPRTLSFLVPRRLHYETLRLAFWRKGLAAARAGKAPMVRSYIRKTDLLGLRASDISTGLDIERCE